MRIQVELQEDIPETVITIKCREQNAYIDKLIAALRMTDRRIAVSYGGNAATLDLEQVLYIESVDGRCFVYTAGQTYESEQRLYELERQLEPYRFLRISKSGIVNLKNIKSIQTYVNRRLLLTMSNEEQLIVSRQYAQDMKEMLGVNVKAFRKKRKDGGKEGEKNGR